MDKFEQYITSIKRKYRERLINRENQWPPCKSNKLVRLELVEGVKGEVYYARHMRGQKRKGIKRTPLKYDDLFKVESGKNPIRKVLVEGDAGIGKTTLSIAICEDWANEKLMLFQRFKMLLLLPLRHQEVASVGSLPEMLQLLHPSEALCEAVSKYLIGTEGDEVLIIADGWDEINSRHQLKQSFLYKLLFKGYLPFASVILTSRYSASAEFHKQLLFDRFVEITGFDKENIIHYIQSEFANKSSKCDDLKEQLEANPLVESVCSVPLNCAIICHLWQLNSKEDIPTTMTELYSKIICNVVFRNIEKDASNSTNISRLSNFDDLPKGLKQPWNYLCEFAFETMAKGQIVFSGDELEAAHNNRLFSFGLLQESLFLLDDGYGRSYHFLHRTFQEFLAAFHLAKLASESSITVTVEEIFPRQVYGFGIILYGDFEIVWRFFFGIYFNILKCHNCHAIMPHVARLYGSYSMCHFAFEAKNDLVYKGIIQTLLMNERAFLYSHSAHDCAATIDVISHMQDCEINIYFGNCGIRQHQINYLGEVLNCKNLQIGRLMLNDNKLVSVESLFSATPNSFQSLMELDLSNNMIKTVNFTRSPFNMLRNINLSDNPLGTNGMNILQTAITGDSLTNLSSLYLNNCFTRDTHEIDSTQFSKFLRALSAHCPNLSKLDLSQNNLGVTGALELAKVKSEHNKVNSSWLCLVKLSRTNLSDESLRLFTKAIDCACYFTVLQLDGNDIHATGLRYLVEASGSGKICFLVRLPDEVLELELEDNPLGPGGLAEIGKLLSSNQSQLMTALRLNRCQLTDRLTHDQNVCNELLIGQQLCQMPHNNTLYRLSMNGNKFTRDGIHILAGLMHLCPSLEVLNTKDCAISSSDFSQLLDKLAQFRSSGATYCHKLHWWDLSCNEIDDEVVPAITKHELSPLFPRLNHVGLNGNMVRDEVVLTIIKKLNGKQSEKESFYNANSSESELLYTETAEEVTSPSEEESFYSAESSESELLCTETEKEVALPISKSYTQTLKSEATDAIPTESSSRQSDDGSGAVSDGQALQSIHATVSPQLLADTAMDQSAVPQTSLLDQELDFENPGVLLHLGKIAESMYEWEGAVADHLGLTKVDVEAIKMKHPGELRLQTREALQRWKQKIGSKATYSKLMDVFKQAGYQNYADTVHKVLTDGTTTVNVHESDVLGPPDAKRKRT